MAQQPSSYRCPTEQFSIWQTVIHISLHSTYYLYQYHLHHVIFEAFEYSVILLKKQIEVALGKT